MKKIENRLIRILYRISVAILIIAVLGSGSVFGINAYVKHSASKHFITVETSEGIKVDCIMVLGAFVSNGKPTPMLRDRLLRGIELYNAGVSDKLLMSGDHGQESYDEVRVMKEFAIERGVPSEDIFMDHAGFSTYESVYRARDVFDVNSIVIVTQEYHLYRAVFVAKKLGLDVYGVTSDFYEYGGQGPRDQREVLARVKDFIYTIIKPKPTYLGEVIPISGDGNLTND